MNYKIFPLLRQTVEVSNIDWIGKMVSVLFLQGCNLNCNYCHNEKLIPLTNFIQENFYKESKENLINIFDFIEKEKNVLDGVVVTGGEPTIWKDKLYNLLNKIKNINDKLDIKLDTNGTDIEVVKNCIERNLVDYIAMDVKANPFDIKNYKEITDDITDFKLKNILSTVNYINTNNIPHEFRITTNKPKEELDFLDILNGPVFLQTIRDEEHKIGQQRIRIK